MRSKSSRIILLISMLILGVVIALLANRHLAQSRWESAPAELKPLLWPEPRALPDFSMREQSGKPFSAEDFKGQWSLLFFGYLQCPDVCPMTLQSMKTLRALMRESGQTGGIPRMVFVSVDPANDTPERMAGYLAFFDESLIGLSGSADQLEALAGPLGIAYAENRDAGGMRSMDHSTSIIVIDAQGRAVAALPSPHQPGVMLRQFNSLRAYLGE